MNVFELVAKLTLDSSEYEHGLDQGESKAKKFGHAFTGALGTVAKVGTAAVGVAVAAVAGLTKASVASFAEYEQLVGGVETMFKDNADLMMLYAKDSYKSAGISANEYMKTVTGFSAALISSLGGNTAEAAELADTAITDMADNANKMGTSMESIQNAYQGFAKQNYTMLDNLKLGYGGTKEEMQRLIDDANKIRAAQGINTKLSIDSFADITSAIHTVQTELGITGTTAKEASTTISGSISSMKAAWQNLLTGLSGGTEDFALNLDTLIDNLVESIIGVENEAGERVGGVLNNILPAVEKTLAGIGKLVQGLAPIIADKLPVIVNTLLPSIASSITTLIQGAAGVIPTLISVLASMLPQILDAGFQVIAALAQGIVQNIPQIVDAAVNAITQFTQYISQHADEVINGALAIIGALASGLLQALPQLLVAAGHLLEELIASLLRKAGEFLQIGWQFISNLASGISQSLGNIGTVIHNVVQTIWNGMIGLGSMGWNWGSDLMSNFVAGIQAWFGNLVATVRNVASTVRSYIGFSEPEKGPLSDFHTFAPDMMKLFAEGIEDNENLIEDAFNNSLSLAAPTVDTNSNTGSGKKSDMREIILNITELIDGSVLARNQYRYNLDEADRHGTNLISAFA